MKKDSKTHDMKFATALAVKRKAAHKMAKGGSVKSRKEGEAAEKGVHKKAFMHEGASESGVFMHEGASEKTKDFAKSKHREVLNELRNMPKPKLSMAEEIRNRKKMFNGGIVDEVVPEHEDDMDLEDGQVDIDDNGKEMPNAFYKRNEDDVLSDSIDEDMMDMEQPEDSNMHTRKVINSLHSMVDKIRAKLKVK